jgi:DNA processing protein
MEQSRTMNKGAYTTIQSKADDFPDILRQMADPPEQLYVQTANWHDLIQRPWIAVVGSRTISPYGKAVTMQLSEEVARAGLVVCSGLAFGVDGVAHQAALEAGGLTAAVLAGGLDTIYPASHHRLARSIVDQGGALISEYPEGTRHYPQHFIARNRIVSGLCRAVLITEATEKSGTMHTARFALEQGKDVLAVPGNVSSATSRGTNNLLRSGAVLVTCAADIFAALGVAPQPRTSITAANPEEQIILTLLAQGSQTAAQLLEASGMSVIIFNQTLTMLEITGKIRGLGNNHWQLH